jgi:integrase
LGLRSVKKSHKVEFLDEQNERNRIISHEEYENLVNALPEYAADVVKVAYWTGMRSGEIFGLTWNRVNLKKRLINLEPKDTKTKEPRTIRLNNKLMELFTRRARVRSIVHNRVFTFPRNNRPLTTIRHSFRRACQEVGIEDFRPHDLRHTFNTNMRKAGVPESVIMKMTGHRSRAMFDRYNTVSREDAQLALDKLDEYLKISKIVSKPQVLLTVKPVSARNH